MLTSMMCVQTQGGGGRGKLSFKFTPVKSGYAYGYWDGIHTGEPKPEPNFFWSVFPEFYVTAGGGMFYMTLAISHLSTSPFGVVVKIKDKSGNYLPAVEFTADRFDRNMETKNWDANNNCDYKIYQRFESLEPVLGEIILI